MFERQLIKYIWAAPYTAIGLAFGAVTLLFGASVRLHGGVFEFRGWTRRAIGVAAPGATSLLGDQLWSRGARYR